MTKKNQGFRFPLPWGSKTSTRSSPKPKTPYSISQTHPEHAMSSSDLNPHFWNIELDPKQLTILSSPGSGNETDQVVVEAQEGSPGVEMEFENSLDSPNQAVNEPSFEKWNIYQLEMGPELKNKNEIDEVTTNSLNKPPGSNIATGVFPENDFPENDAKNGNVTEPSSNSEENETESMTSYFMNVNDMIELDTYTPDGCNGERTCMVKEIEEEIFKFVQQLRRRKNENIGCVITLVGENNGVYMQLCSDKEIEESKRCVNRTIQGINNSVEHNLSIIDWDGFMFNDT